MSIKSFGRFFAKPPSQSTANNSAPVKKEDHPWHGYKQRLFLFVPSVTAREPDDDPDFSWRPEPDHKI